MAKWTPAELEQDVVAIEGALASDLPDLDTARRDVQAIEARLLTAALAHPKLDVSIAITGGALGFGAFDNSKQRGFYIDTTLDRVPLSQSPLFWTGYGAIPDLVAAVRTSVGARASAAVLHSRA